jgi:hypothetical protein
LHLACAVEHQQSAAAHSSSINIPECLPLLPPPLPLLLLLLLLQVTRQVFEAAKGKLKVVGRAGVGVDNVDLAAATEVRQMRYIHNQSTICLHVFTCSCKRGQPQSRSALNCRRGLPTS